MLSRLRITSKEVVQALLYRARAPLAQKRGFGSFLVQAVPNPADQFPNSAWLFLLSLLLAVSCCRGIGFGNESPVHNPFFPQLRSPYPPTLQRSQLLLLCLPPAVTCCRHKGGSVSGWRLGDQ